MVLPVGVADHAASIVEHVTERRVHLVGGFLPRPVQRLAGIVLAITRYGYVRDSKEHVREVLHEEGPERQGFAGFVIGR
jgi:hypothetical protein